MEDWEHILKKFQEQSAEEKRHEARRAEHLYLLSGAIRHIKAMTGAWDPVYGLNDTWDDALKNAEFFLTDLRLNGLI